MNIKNRLSPLFIVSVYVENLKIQIISSFQLNCVAHPGVRINFFIHQFIFSYRRDVYLQFNKTIVTIFKSII